MPKINYIFLAILLVFSISCNQTYLPKKQEIGFSGKPFVLNVANITVIEEYTTSKKLPNVEGLSDITPSDALKKWVSDRLVAGGNKNTAEVVITDAHINKKQIPKTKSGVEGYFTNEQTEEYFGELAVEIKIYDERRNLPIAKINVSSKNTRTLPENATIIDHENIYHDMSIELMTLLENSLNQNIKDHFGNYIIYR